jgi:hypothetical protein
MKLIGSKESGTKKYMGVREYTPGKYSVSETTWNRYVDRCRTAGETPVNPDDDGIIITSNDLSNAAAALGRKGGAVKSERKTAAVRENGKKGGRPPKSK